jgi:hypothetical protein
MIKKFDPAKASPQTLRKIISEENITKYGGQLVSLRVAENNLLLNVSYTEAGLLSTYTKEGKPLEVLTSSGINPLYRIETYYPMNQFKIEKMGRKNENGQWEVIKDKFYETIDNSLQGPEVWGLSKAMALLIPIRNKVNLDYENPINTGGANTANESN